MKYYVLVVFLLNSMIACCQVNLLVNSNFAQANYGWQTAGSFYYGSNFQSCNSCPGYAYFSNSNGTTSNNLSGQLYQSTSIPTNVSSAIFSFAYSIHTSEPNTGAKDILTVAFYVNNIEVWRAFNLSNQNATTYPGGPPNYQTISTSVPANLIGQSVTVVFIASSDGANPTVFRIDDVQLLATLGPPGIRTGCLTWTNGNLPGSDVINAAENLCNQRYIENSIDVNELQYFTVANASVKTVTALYGGSMPSSLPSDFFPTFFGDIDGLRDDEYQAIKAMCFLEYDDGRSCLNRDHTQILPHSVITKGSILRMLYEAWNIAPDMQGYNLFSHDLSSFSNIIHNDDFNYGYFKRAYQDGILGNYIYNSGFIDNNNVKPGEFYLVVLSNLVNRYGRRNVSTSNYYNPNNIKLTNASVATDITRGVFKTYEQSGFDIPSGGLGLNFTYSYHSDLVDIPSLGYNLYNYEYGNIVEHLAQERTFPLGLGWTHTYNIYAQSVPDEQGNDKYIIVHWGDGSIMVYDVPHQKFASAGVYDTFNVISRDGSHVASFNIVSKDQVTTRFNVSTNSDVRAPSFFQAVLISNQNNQSLNLVYESSNCAGQSNCYGSSAQRLFRAIDNFTNRILTFHYAPGTDLLSSVSDNSTGRSINFNVNNTTLNLDNVTNARKYSTSYTYGSTDVDNHLLMSITRPVGNTIYNTYAARKLKQTQTPDYITKVDFTPNYSNSNISTQSVVTTTPFSGTQYAISYTHSTTGTVSTITSASSNISLTYGDSQNPTLPTSVIDNQTNIRQNFQYDSRGNVLQSDYSGGGLTQTNQYTYDPTNHVLSHTWPNNTVTRYSYDGNGNQLNETTGNYKVDYSYSSNGLPIAKTDANGVVTNFGYDSYGDLASIAISGTPIHYSAYYDAASRLTSIIDGNTVETFYSYDDNDNLQSVIQDKQGLHLQTVYSYDGNDNLRDISPPQGSDVALGYNGTDDLISELQTGLERHWNYNTDGSLNTYTDKNQHLFSYTYYATNDANEGKLKSNGVQNFTYSTTNHLVTSVSASPPERGTINYGYDQLLRPNEISATTPSYSGDVTYAYDISGNITKINLVNEGKFINYSYDELNRIKTIKDWNGNIIITYNYKNNGQLDNEQLSNGSAVFYHYDLANRLDSIYSLKSDRVTRMHSAGCSMDNNGNHTRESYFVNWTGKAGTEYPPQANTQFTYDKQYDWLLNANSQGVTNEKSGNINNNYYSGLTGAAYDLHNNLTDCTIDGKVRKYLYDALDSRYGNSDLRYTVDHINNSNVLSIRKIGAANPTAIYVYSPYGLVCSIDPTTTDKTFYLYDFRGSTIATINQVQTVTDYYKYDAWGNVTEASTTPGATTPFLFVGKYGVMYESPHLYFMRARYYDPTIGRFLGGDSQWSANLFAYAGNDPINDIDPNGLNKTSTTILNQLKRAVAVTKKSFTDPNTYKLAFAAASIMVDVPEAGLSNEEIIQNSATNAESAVGGRGPLAGIAKHTNAINSVKTIQDAYGDMGLEFNKYFNNGANNRGFLDIIDHPNQTIYDYKFGDASMSFKQFQKYSRNFPGYSIKIVRP